MKLIREIFNKDLGLDTNKKDRAYNLYRASRGVILNESGQVALLNVKNEGYHKLPGGKIAKDESKEEALHREILEETGCRLKEINEIGLVIEYSDDTNFMQISFAYSANVSGYESVSLSENEKIQGIVVEWYALDDAIKVLSTEAPDTYHGKFIVNRDLGIINEFINTK